MHGSGDYERARYRDRADYGRDGFERLGSRVMEFLRSRTVDQWLMFLAGVVVGMIIG